MKKSEIIECLKAGGSMSVNAENYFFGELRNCAEAAREGGGTLTVTHSEWLSYERIKILCKDGRGHISFPEVKTDD